ncbi:MAG TPA: serine/threonine-protein kinase [Polyangiaceae bacterium]|jgi:serine/threonine protein kinase|nr:serine/threonine-protein kinase [Polyangiaceae bacterium]
MVQLASTAVREGDLLAGKYRVERVIGSGGMGIVVAARHEQLGQLVAIKLVRDEALDQGDTVERFLREARAAVQLRSEHVAKVLDVGKLESGAPYMVMEFLDGNDLGHVLSENGPMALDVAVLFMLQACEAVSEAHAAGIVHRDLKPQNLFLTRTLSGSPRLKVLDFGVSKTTGLTQDGKGALTRTRAMLGSPLYMAPEQMRSSRDVDARVDVWALGVVLFELLTRRWPFEAESMPELCLKVVTEPPRPLAEFRPELPPGVGAIIERCLAKEPGGRFASVAEFATALEPFAPPMLARVSTERYRPSVTALGLAGPDVRPELGRPTLPSPEYPRLALAPQNALGANSGVNPTSISAAPATSSAAPATSAAPAPSVPSGPTPASWGSSRSQPGKAGGNRKAGPIAVAVVIGVVGIIALGLIRRGTSDSAAASRGDGNAAAAGTGVAESPIRATPPVVPIVTSTPTGAGAAAVAETNAGAAAAGTNDAATAEAPAAEVARAVIAPLPETPAPEDTRSATTSPKHDPGHDARDAVGHPSMRTVYAAPSRPSNSAPGAHNTPTDDDIPALR